MSNALQTIPSKTINARPSRRLTTAYERMITTNALSVRTDIILMLTKQPVTGLAIYVRGSTLKQVFVSPAPVMFLLSMENVLTLTVYYPRSIPAVPANPASYSMKQQRFAKRMTPFARINSMGNV